MADIIKTKNVLTNVFSFADGDTRTLNLDNPNDSITAADVQAWGDFAKNNNLILGDKAGAVLEGIISSKILERTETTLDLT